MSFITTLMRRYIEGLGSNLFKIKYNVYSSQVGQKLCQ